MVLTLIVSQQSIIHISKANFGTSEIYEVLSNLIHGRRIPTDKDGQELTEEVVNQGMAVISQFISDKTYSDLLAETETATLVDAISSEDLYHRIISIRLLFERVDGALSLLRKEFPAACKFVNETNHIENDYIFQLDPRKYFNIPSLYLEQIANFINKHKSTILAGMILSDDAAQISEDI